MNAHLHEELMEIAERAGALVHCIEGHSGLVRAWDSDADSRAYAMATSAFQGGNFPRSNLTEIRHEMKVVLDNANHECPTCMGYRG